MSKSKMAGLYGKHILSLKETTNCFQECYTTLYSQYYMRDILVLYERSNFSAFVSTWYFLILAVLIDVYLIRVPISISLMVNDVEHLYMCLFAIHLFVSVKCLFMSFASFLIELFFYCWASIKILIYSRYQCFVKYMVL